MSRGFVGAALVAIIGAVCLAATLSAQQPPQARAERAYVVQFEGPVRDEWKAALSESGADILEYVPHFSFRVRMTPDVAVRVRRLSFVSSVERLQPARRQSPVLVRNGQRAYLIRLDGLEDPDTVRAALTAAGVQVLRRGRSHVLVVADGRQADAIAGLDGVASIENFSLRIKHNEYGGGVIVGGNVANSNGFDGSSQTISIADTGIGNGNVYAAHPGIAPGRIMLFNWPGVPDFCFETVANDGAIDVDSGHGTHVATTALGAGNANGVGRGTAPAASLVFQAIENYAIPSFLCSLLLGIPDGYYLVGIPDDVGDLFQTGYSAGARVHSNSWGSEVSGAYTADAANTDIFVWDHRDAAIVFSAGNSGTDANADGIVDAGSINSPGSAKNVITVGASENDRQSHWECDPGLTYNACASQGGQNLLMSYGIGWPERFAANPLRDDPTAGNADQIAAFSSRGPTTDGRIKPDVVAPGTWILSGYSVLHRQGYDPTPNVLTGNYQYDGWGHPFDAEYKYMGGTSMSAPLVAGGAAVVRDAYFKSRGHHASAALVKATLINSAVDLLDENNDGVFDNAHPIPNVHEGWGRIDLERATNGNQQIDDETTPLSTGSSASFAYPVTAAGVPLKVTLAWTDYPSNPSATVNLVNDLDLTVVGPDGSTYRGNVFAGGWSAPGGGFDRVNNVENVYVFAAAAGTWTVIVSGYNVPNGPQTFALVVDSPSEGGSALPSVRVTADDATATEAGPTGGVIRFTRSGNVDGDLTLEYTVGGSASAGADYVALPGFVTIPQGAVDVTVPIEALDDSAYEPVESVVVTLSPSVSYSLGSPSAVSVSITSDDLPPDLVVTSMLGPSSAPAGSQVTYNDTTKNQGFGHAVASETGFYLSANSLYDALDQFLTSHPVSALAPGASEAAATTFTIPAETAPGVYYVLAKADWSGDVGETSDANNVRASGTLRIGPDLLILTMSGPATAAAGDQISVSDVTKNQGADLAAETKTTFYLSTNTALDAGDLVLGSRTVPELGPGAQHTVPTTLAIPVSTAVGSYYVIAQADADAAVVEHTETNNVKSSSVLRIGADLTVTALTGPATAGAGNTIEVVETTRNGGAADSPASTTLFYLSLNGSIDASDAFLGSRPVPLLEAGMSDTATVSLTIPAGTVTDTHYVLAKADGLNEVAETSETNNVRSSRVDVGPDLLVTAVSVPAVGAPGGSLSVSDMTRNVGGAPAPETVTAFYLSANTSLDISDVLLDVRAVPALGPAGTNIGSVTLTVPSNTAVGNYYVLVKADQPSAVVEVLETNNVKASLLIRIGPDLTVFTVNAPAIVVRGTTFTITDTTRNDGGGAAGATTTSYYLSTNASWDATDLLLGSHGVGSLGPGASENGQASVVVPASQPTGNYYIIAKADAGGVVAETLETNNTKYKSIKINP